MAKKSSTALREQLAAQRAAQEAAQRRRRMLGVGALAAAVLIAVVGIMLAVSLNKPSSPSPSAAPTGSAGYVASLQHVPAASLDAVGVGSAQNTAQLIKDGQVVIKDGKPRVLYIGADYCPYCGVERWPLVIALSRFGTFSGLQPALSSPDEGQLSNVPTVAFTGVKYASDYLTFDAVETADRMGNPLTKPAPDDQLLLDKFDPGAQGNPIPWFYWGTQHQIGASFGGAKFMPGASGDAIAAKLADTGSVQAQGILGAANIHTARLCQLTGGKPGDVCTSAGVQAAAKVLG